MAKSAKNTVFVLRVSGLIFAVIGIFHIARYFLKIEFRVGGFELTYLGSLIGGVLILLLSVACFANSKK